MNADLRKIKAADEPARFLIAAVLSPDDTDMDCSDAAFSVLLDEEFRLAGSGPMTRLGRRLNSVQKALATLKALRRAGKGK